MEIISLSKDKTSGKISFLVKNTSPIFINTLRRAIIDEVPTMAIETVELKKNSSILYDEIIAHRLGLLPLTTDLESYSLPEKCKCNKAGCAACQLKLTLKAKGGIVTAGKMKSMDPKVVPVHAEMPIAKLLKEQELEFEATAILGKGKDHVKWSPGLVFFNGQPQLTINNDSQKLNEFRSKYPSQIFDKSGKIDKNAIIDLNLADACAGVCDEVIKVEYSNSNFILNIEPFGQLTAKQMLFTAIEILDEKLDKLAELVKA